MSLSKWMIKNAKGKGAKLGELVGSLTTEARGAAEGALSAAKKSGGELVKAGGNVARGVAAAHPGKLAAAAGSAGILAALGLSDDDDTADGGEPKMDAKKQVPAKAGTSKKKT